MADHEPCEVCGRDGAGDHSECHNQAELRINELISAFQLRRVNTDNRAEYERAVRTVSQSAGQRVEVDESQALEAESWWFIPAVWIGCSGYIVEKESEEVTALGSGLSLDLWFWGHERGALKSPCTLVINRVNSASHSLQLMRKLDMSEVPVQFPHRVQANTLWLALPVLKEAEETGAFEFHVE